MNFDKVHEAESDFYRFSYALEDLVKKKSPVDPANVDYWSVMLPLIQALTGRIQSETWKADAVMGKESRIPTPALGNDDDIPF